MEYFFSVVFVFVHNYRFSVLLSPLISSQSSVSAKLNQKKLLVYVYKNKSNLCFLSVTRLFSHNTTICCWFEMHTALSQHQRNRSYLLNCWCVRTKPSRRIGNFTSQLPTMFWILKSRNLAGKPSFCTTRAYFLAANLDCSSLVTRLLMKQSLLYIRNILLYNSGFYYEL